MPGTADNGLGSQIAVKLAFTYNANDQVLSVTDSLGHATTYGYDNLGRQTTVTDALNHTTSYGYDPAGNRTTITNPAPLGYVTTSTYDARDRLVSQTAPSGGGTTAYTYDNASRLVSVTDPVGNVTRYSYDNANRLALEVDPLGHTTTFAYDVANNVTSVTDRNGRVTSYGYDADNRLTTEQWLSGGSAIYTSTTTYDPAGRPTGVTDNSSHYAYGYDAANRLTTINDQGTTGLPQVTLTYGYDNVGNRTSLADSLGGVNSYTYDVRNELTQITQSGTGVASKSVQMAYDAAGRATSLTRYADLTGTTKVAVTASGYDNANRLTTLTHQTAGGATIASYGYTLDAANRLTSEARTWNGGSSTDTVTYGYTNNDQVTSVTHTNGSFANETFSYDANGNRNSTGYATGTGNEVSSDGTSTYAYDNEGNLISKTAIATGNQTLYTWDYRNRLTEVDTKVGATTTPVAVYTYDALNRPIKVVEGGVTRSTLYDGQTPLLDFNATGTVTARYLDGPAVDQVLARETTGGVVAWYITDRLGTVRDIVNTSGTVIDHIDYSVNGNVTAESNPSNGDRFKFAGMEYDTATQLYYDRARWYDPIMERLISQDPVGITSGDPNYYRYVDNNTLNAKDDTGLYKIIFKGKWTPGEMQDVNLRMLRSRYRFMQHAVFVRLWKNKLTPCEKKLIGGGLNELSDLLYLMMSNLDSKRPLWLSHSSGGWAENRSGTRTAPWFGIPTQIWLNDDYHAMDGPDILVHELSHDAGTVDPYSWVDAPGWDASFAQNVQDLGSTEDFTKTHIYSSLMALMTARCPGGTAPPASPMPKSSPSPFFPWWGTPP